MIDRHHASYSSPYTVAEEPRSQTRGCLEAIASRRRPVPTPYRVFSSTGQGGACATFSHLSASGVAVFSRFLRSSLLRI